MNLINVLNIVIIVLMLVPNIIYTIKAKNFKNLCTNRVMNALEWIGRILCIALMIYPLGKKEFGFPSAESFIIYVFGNIILVAVYLIVWISYFKKENKLKSVVLTLSPVGIFLICGLTLEHWLLVFSAVLFGIGHIYVTLANSIKKQAEKKAVQKEENKAVTETTGTKTE